MLLMLTAKELIQDEVSYIENIAATGDISVRSIANWRRDLNRHRCLRAIGVAFTSRLQVDADY